jgi:imidazolonepropionase-like amidohydrolase
MTRRSYYLISFCVALLFWLIPVRVAQAQQQATLVIEGGTLIDGNGGAPVADALIIIQGNRITNVLRKGQGSFPANAQVIKADGKFILPGLWEAETVYGWFGGEATLAHGVTSTSDIANKGELSILHKEAVNRGKTGGPRTFIGIGYMSSQGRSRHQGRGPDFFATPLSPDSVPKSAEEAREIAKRLIAAGTDMVMFMDGALPVEYVHAAFEEAHKAGKPTVMRPAGPVIFPQAAVLAGLDILSHSAGIDFAVAKDPSKKWRNELDRYSDMDDKKAADLIQLLVQHKVTLAPTLIRKGEGFHKETPRFLEQDRKWWFSNPNLRVYFPEKMFEAELIEATPLELESAVLERRKKGYQNLLRFHRQFVQAGGHLIAGGNSPFVCPPGLCLHQELEVFADAGLTPMQMIQSATKWPAEAFRVQDKLGTIETGKLADVLIVKADPLQDIRNLQEIDAVIYDGKVQDRTYHAAYHPPFLGGTGLSENIVVEDVPWVIAMKAGTNRGEEETTADAIRGHPVPPPGIETISPVIVTQGSPALTLTIKGVNFLESSRVYVDNTVVPSRRVSSTELQVTIDENLLRRVGRFDIVVKTPGLISPGWRADDGTSNVAHLLVDFKY